MAEVFAIYNPAKPARYVHPEGGWLNYSGDDPVADESIPRPISRETLKSGKPATDPK